jgi:hypothetical protein
MYLKKIFYEGNTFKYLELCLLIPILIIAIILNFYHHIDYSYFFHVDEWFHISWAKQAAMGLSVDWYIGESFQLSLERGWHGFLSLIYLIFKPTVTQWIYLPTILHVLAVSSVYAFVSKLYGKNEGLISAFLIAVLPTNVTIGGPVFLIPVNLGLIFIPMALVFAFKLTKLKDFYNYIILFLITVFLFYSHPPTAVVLLTILSFYTLLNVFSKNEECKKRGKFLLYTIILTVLASFPNYIGELQRKGLSSVSFDFWVLIKEIPLVYGLIPTFFFILGFYLKTKSDDKKTWALLISSIFLLFNIVIFTRLGLNFILPYQRTFVPLFLLMSVIASVGFIKVLKIKQPFKKIGIVLLIILLVSTGIISINNNLNSSYYKIIDDVDYDNFIWIKENTEEDAWVVCDPWLARALAPVAERVVYAVMPFGPNEKYLNLVNNANVFLNNGCSNTSFLINNNISVIYTRGYIVSNPYLFKVKEDIYFLKDEFRK